MKYKIFTSLLFMLFAFQILHAQDELVGYEKHWRNDTTIFDDVIIGDNVELIIHHSVRVDFQNSKLEVYGKLTAIGGPFPNSYIKLTSSSSGGWKGIKLYNSESSELKYCRIDSIYPDISQKDDQGAIYLNGSNKFKMSNCFFEENQGGVVIVNSSDAKILNNFFLDNSIVGFQRGLIYCETTSLAIISGNSFKNNYLNQDGVIAVRYGSEAIIQNNIFEFNYDNNPNLNNPIIRAHNEAIFGNSLFVLDNTFSDNADIDILLGTNSNARIINNTFSGDQYDSTHNTAIRAFKTRITYLDNCSFNNYNANCIESYSSRTIIDNCDFIGNNQSGFEGEGGSCIYIHGYSISNEPTGCLIKNSNFSGNWGNNGGAIYAEVNNNNVFCSLHIESNVFYNNHCITNGNGGAMFVKNTNNLFVTKNRFEDNQCNGSGNGGAIFLQNTNAAISQNSFYADSTNGLGGAIYNEVSDTEFFIFQLVENDFFFNYSESGGGAVYAHSTQPEIYYAFSFLSYKNKFYFNSTNGSGGAIFTRQSMINFHDNMICKNIADTGGGICCESLFTAETANNFIYANEANLSGGGLYLNDCQYYLPIRISDNVFRGNTYTNKGGGACIENCKHVNMDRNLFVSNTGPFTTSQGNGSYINNSSTDIFNSIYHMNVSASTYGALSIGGLQTQDTINITNCNFSSNDETGGIVVNVPISESQLNIMNNIFWGNSYRSIINPYNSAKLYPNYCWTNEFNLGNVEFLNSIIGTVPGWVSNVNFNLKQNSACIDGGNPQNIYNDFYFPPAYLNGPSWGTETNDIGATGGPKAANDSASILYHIPQIIGAEVAFTYSVIDPTENIVEFTDNSQVDPNFENHARWVFGDGESYGYLYTTTPPVSFTHNYDNDLTQVKVTLIIETPNDIVKTSQTVDLSNSAEPVLKGVTTQKFVAFKTTEADKILENSNDKIPAIDITIFPNPSSGAFTILLGTISIVAPPKITIYNAFGNLVTTIQKSEIINNEVYVNLANCPPGIYLVKIDSSGKSIFKKVLIQNSNN